MQDQDRLLDDAIARSGYPLEQRVEATCHEMLLEVSANAPMTDPVSGKARETDFFARWAEPQTTDRMRICPSIIAELYIECVRTETPLIFYEKPSTYVECGAMPTLFGFPLYLEDPPGSSGFGRLEDYAEVSWWSTRPDVATQWNGFERKQDKKGQPYFVTSQRHDIHTTLEKLVNRAEAAAEKCVLPWQIESAFMGGWLMFIRPLLVVEGELLSSVLGPEGQGREPREHVHYIRKAIWKGRHVAWFIDVVTEAGLRGYLTRLKQRMEKLELFCMQNTERVQGALASKSAQHLGTIRPMSCLRAE